MVWSHLVEFRLDVMAIAANRTLFARVHRAGPPATCGIMTERSLIVLYAQGRVNDTCVAVGLRCIMGQ